jgi:putative ABC transport system permease protein
MPRTPLAWANLSHDRVRFVLFVLGIVFAVTLMFMQIGFRGALLDSQTLVHERMNADLVLVSPNRDALPMREPISRRRLTEAAAVPGVKSVHPLYVENGLAILKNTNPDPAERAPSRAARVIGVDPDAFLLNLPELDPADRRYLADRLKEPDTALFDRRSREGDRPGESAFGPLAEGARTELTGRRLTLVGGFDLGTDFTSDGTLIVSERTFADLLRRPYTLGAPLADVDFGLVRLEPGADVEQVRRAIRAAVNNPGADPDVDVLTPAELTAREQTFWLDNTPIGFAFKFGMAIGFIVGAVICYQILSGDVSDHLPEYATLKAVGYTNRDLARVVLQEALILAVAGWAVGFALSWALYEWLTDTTGMPLRMTAGKAAVVLAIAVGMCTVSGLMALGKLFRADPADVFG